MPLNISAVLIARATQKNRCPRKMTRNRNIRRGGCARQLGVPGISVLSRIRWLMRGWPKRAVGSDTAADAITATLCHHSLAHLSLVFLANVRLGRSRVDEISKIVPGFARFEYQQALQRCRFEWARPIGSWRKTIRLQQHVRQVYICDGDEERKSTSRHTGEIRRIIFE